VKIHAIEIAEHLGDLSTILEHGSSGLGQVIQRGVAPQRLAEGRDGTGLDLGQLLRHAQHALAQPDLQVLGKVADGLGQGVWYRAEHIRYDDINGVLVELIVHLVRE